MWVLRVVIVLCVPLMNDASIWGSWGSCTKTCGIGTQIRQRLNSTGDVLESETQYCNTQPCAVEKTCRYYWDCNGDYGTVKCRNNTCLCTGGEGFNVANCFPQKGTCAILKNPPTSIGYKDPSVKYPRYNRYHLYSCTTNDNPKYEVHVVSLPECFTAECFNKTNTNEISIVPRGPVVKPIILVLTSNSHLTTHSWKIETPVGINKVMFGRFSTVENKSSSKCDFRVFQKLNLKTGDGTDKETSELLRSVYDDYGPITSVTAYRFHRVASVFKIILSVGGNPLQVLPHGYTYKVSSNCTEGMLDCPLMNPQTTAISSSVQTYSWTQWSSCTKTCNIGTQSRCRYNNALQKIEYEEQYCNTQYCPGVDLSCNTTNDCLRQTGWSSAFMNTECKNNVCRCSLEDKYNKHNCFGEVGNCVIRKEPQTALGYKDPSDTYPYPILELESCTTNDNSVYELHVISIFGLDEIYEVSIKPRGPVSKPIILVLISCSSVHWRLETPVGLYKVLIVGCRYSNTTVEKNSSSKCSFEATQRSDIRHFFPRGDVPDLTKLSIEFGPITSYTRYLKIFSKTTPRIILEVGGSPLQVLTRDYTYDASQLSCESPTPPLAPPPL
ncbi:uncharacterized protein LOC143048363 isoform X1 [Mytilus galloprovincialis]|uniref:uncharacterized protein LOC143048363 isoform X1 n=1 Tax=Mytilus galloprovincialis TaxID=29158 RepID=UPI003F7BE900